MTRIMIVDDHPVVRDGMEAMLENESDFKVVASVADGQSAIETCRRMGAPDVVVMDIRMPGMKLKRTFADISVLLLAGMPLKVEVEDARRLGARGYLPKSIDWAKLVAAIRRAASDDATFIEESCVDEKVGPLSPREQEIIKYLSLGKTHEEMAIIFGISPETVRSHVKGIFRKLDCSHAAAPTRRAPSAAPTSSASYGREGTIPFFGE